MTHNDALAAFLGAELFDRLGWTELSESQRDAILGVFRVGICAGAASGTVSTIDAVLGEGRVVLCEDGSRWSAVADDDAELIDDWGAGALVAIHKGLVYRLDPHQCAEVEMLSI